MGLIDLVIKDYVRFLFPYVVIAFILYKLRFGIRYVYKVGYAWVLNRVGKAYNKLLGRKKQKLFTEMHDMKRDSDTEAEPFRILEVGAGSGANFKYFPEGADIVCVDPNPHFKSYLLKNASEFNHVVLDKFVVAYGEDMKDVPSESVDAVVTTIMMCTVADVQKTLSEILRVLKKGGKYFYMEHVAAEEDTFLYKVQNFLTPVWRIFGDNCHLNRNTGRSIREAGFSEVNQEHFRARTRMTLISPHLCGIATK